MFELPIKFIIITIIIKSCAFLETNSMILNNKSIGKWSDESCPEEHLGENCLAGNCSGGNIRESELHGWKLLNDGNNGLRVWLGIFEFGIFYSSKMLNFGMS